MDLVHFEQSLEKDEPPSGLIAVLAALWHDAKGDWQKAHEIVQNLSGSEACWVHAYLHREEGDNWNADYWYQRAGRDRPSGSLRQEWRGIVSELLNEP